jgi:serine/threonine protein kinase
MNDDEQSAIPPVEIVDPYATHDKQREGLQAQSLTNLIGRYRVERLLGAGSFGSVYQALDDRLNRRVAVKVPHSHLIHTAGDAEAYLNEARTVAILDHPHIVPVYDVGTTADIPCYVVSKFISGMDMCSWSRVNRPSTQELAELVLTIAEALHYAHRQGVVHRDVKPSNILIDDSGRPYVVDFGLALEVKNRGMGPEFAGTPAYMSPEQARGEGNRVDGRSDIFSLGVVLYELLCRRLPFQGKSLQELLEHILHWEPVPPRQIEDSIPKALEQICLKAIAKRASDRYSTARDLADDLRDFLGRNSTYSGKPTSSDVASQETAPPLTTQVFAAEKNKSTIDLPLAARPLPLDNFGTGEATGKQKWIGEFQIIEKLGQGGMGAVYRAWHPLLRRQVALKVLLTIGNEKHEQRFAREIRALGPVRDEHLAEVFSSGSQDGMFYYAMELIEGTPLDVVCQHLQTSGSAVDQLELSKWQAAVSTVCESTRVTQGEDTPSPVAAYLPQTDTAHQQNVPLPKGRTYAEHIAELIRQVANAAHKLHQVGVVHRDIKPGNIMVGYAGTKAVLIDLGLAQLADESDGKVTRTRQFVGTLRYASPEQVLAVSRIDCRSDVYSLGATLWELLTLRAMFNSGDQTPTPELMSRIQYEEPESLRLYNRNVHKDLEAIVLKCLEKNPNLRYSSAHALAADLDAFLNQMPVSARPISQIKRWGRRLRKTSRGVWVGSGLVLTMCVIFGVLQYRNLQHQSALRGIKQQFNEQLSELKLDLDQGQSVLKTLEQMKANFPDEESVQRPEFELRWRSLIENRMRDQARLEPEDIRKFQECIELYTDNSPNRIELFKILQKRQQRGSVFLNLHAPFTDAQVIFPDHAEVNEQSKLIHIQSNDNSYVKSTIQNDADSELEIHFASEHWIDKELGIELGTGDMGVENHYRVAVKGRNVEPITKGDRLRIMRGKLILREREVFLDNRALKLRLKRQGRELVFQTNDLPQMTFGDIFPIRSGVRGQSGVLAFSMPVDVGIASIKAVKYLSEEQSRFDEADRLFAEGRFSQAAEIYDKQALAGTAEVSQEARYKRARCLEELSSLDEAMKILHELSTEQGHQWPALATCEVCSLSLLQKDYNGADEAILHLLELTPDRRIYSTLFERIDTRVIAGYSTTMSISRQFLLDEKLVKPLCTLMLLLQENVEDLPIARQLKTAMRLGDACVRTGLDVQAEKLFRSALSHRQPYKTATTSTELDDSLAIFRDLVWLLIRQNRLLEAMDVVDTYERSPDLPEIFKAILALETARVYAAQEQIEPARESLNKFFNLADEWENFDSCELAEAYLLKGFLAENSVARQQIWNDAYRLCKRPETVSDIRMAMLASASGALTDADADLMISQVAGRLDAATVPMLRTIAYQMFDRQEIWLALQKMWSSPRGLEYVKVHVQRTATPEAVVIIQVPLSLYEICRQSAFNGNPSAEIDDMIWNSFIQLSELYKKGEIGLPGLTQLFYAWQGRFQTFAGWGSIAPLLPSDDLRAKLAFLCGCHMKNTNKPDIATKFFREAMKYASDDANLKRIIESESNPSVE